MTPWLLKKLGNTVLPEILPQTTFFSLIAVLIAVLCPIYGNRLVVSTVMLSVLTTMLSFAISLRTSSALERFGEGRKACTQLTRISRDFATMAMPAEKEEEERCRALIEKRTIIGLIQAFSVAAKHYLRNEAGVHYEDLYHLVACLPRYHFPSSVHDDVANEAADRSYISGMWRSPGPDGTVLLPYETPSGHITRGAATPETSHSLMFGGTGTGTGASKDVFVDMEKANEGLRRSKRTLLPAYNPPPFSVYRKAPVLKIFRPIIRLFSKREQEKFIRRRRVEPESNIPLEISLFLSGYVAALVNRNTLPAPYYSIFYGQLVNFQDAISTLERVVTTPLPFAYNMHLRATTYVYLVFLPFQIYSALGYLTIPAMFIASCVFLGFLELGTQLENPFGYDDSDLDLDGFCQLIERELKEIVAHPQPAPSTYVFSPLNTPFLPSGDSRSAPEILADLVAAQDGSQDRGVPLLRKIFAQQAVRHRGTVDFGSKGSKRRGPSPSTSIDVFSV